MEITINNFENSAASVLFEDQHLSVAIQTLNSPGDDDENDENDEEDEGTKSNDNDNPPADEEVVFSPVPTQPGKPRT